MNHRINIDLWVGSGINVKSSIGNTVSDHHMLQYRLLNYLVLQTGLCRLI